MRRLMLALLLTVALPLAAQDKPKNLQPLPDVPPPPPGVADSGLEPEVTIKQRGQDKVEEYRINGRLYMIKVTPPNGTAYYLIDDKGEGQWTRQDSLDTRLRVPMWVIKTF